DNLSDEKLSHYQKFWEKEMKEEITAAMKLRESYLDFDDSDIDLIIRFLNKTKCHKLILKNADIDYPSCLAKKLISIGPRNSSLFIKALKIAGNTNLI
ncbi:MAG: geranylgeranyl reductase family protein, partial [Eubacteriales bacterium]